MLAKRYRIMAGVLFVLISFMIMYIIISYKSSLNLIHQPESSVSTVRYENRYCQNNNGDNGLYLSKNEVKKICKWLNEVKIGVFADHHSISPMSYDERVLVTLDNGGTFSIIPGKYICIADKYYKIKDGDKKWKEYQKIIKL